MAEIAQLKTHIIQYSKTREVYAAYKKSRHKKDFLTEHGAEIAQHEAAKKAEGAEEGDKKEGKANRGRSSVAPRYFRFAHNSSTVSEAA